MVRRFRLGAALAGAALAGLAGLLAGCGFSVDAGQARVCRLALPALNPDKARITVLKTAPGPDSQSVRIDYEVERPDRIPLHRHAVCRFPGEGLSPDKTDLVGLETERGPLAGASLYLLKHYYIDTPEGIADDPGPGMADAGLPEVPRLAAYLIQQILVSLPRTAIYGLLAAAYALVFGLVGRINLAFGELAAIGAAATVSGAAIVLGFGVSAPAAGLGLGLACAAFAGTIHSAVGGYLTIAEVKSPSPQPSLIATVGLSIFLMEYLRLAQSPVMVWLPPIWSEAVPLVRAGSFVVGVTPVTLVTAGIGLAAAAALLGLLHATGFGRAWRAYADDARAAALMGVDGGALLVWTLAIAGGMAGLAGMLVVTQYGGLGFAGGFQLGLKALIAAVLGGIAIGAFETLWSAFLPIDARDIALFSALIAVLIFRPGGFLGIRDPSPRQV